ncbi:MAG: aspartate--tRNA(Asn) ligase [Phenylobacterium sp.]|uniref:aspartate--tRNA(Asn) ligase n=1 Tax=Phenylobacterium sp. TaxID=1871053 RepID=UPI0025FC3757|nr:aspartate--tRNA(Asn) ligase [Phenylobacterium sp.]MCA3722418.1 aspartate--tRNA(Asn) ligase [Phenylobacterium sp.]MCA6253534.1 aspartate--tRNA(Asn) ligase [Phenylobacterium sp.]
MEPIRDRQTTHPAIEDLRRHIGAVVTLDGSVETLRDQKRMQFLILNRHGGAVQVVHEKAGADDRLAQRLGALTPGSAVTVTGTVREAASVKLNGLEIEAADIVVHSLAATPLPVAADSSLEKQIDWRVLSLRRPEQRLVFEVQTTLEQAMRAYWARKGFIEIHSPKLMGTFSESGAEAFQVQYFDRTAYLAQSPQFYKQMAMAAGFERVFEVGPAFRAEPSFTARHETEFTSIDMEVAWTDSHQDLMALEEDWLVEVLTQVAAVHGQALEELLGVRIDVPVRPFPRVSLQEAQAIVRASGHTPTKTDDLDPEGERRLWAHVAREYGHDFVFVTDYPVTARPFYHRRHRDRRDLTQSFDLLWRGIEITTGAQREHRYDPLKAQAVERGYDLEPLSSYIDFFRYGCPPHGGMGVGLARLLMVMLQRSSIREVTFLSRSPTRLTP